MSKTYEDKFKKDSIFKKDDFKYSSDNFTKEELKDIERKEYDSDYVKRMQEEKDTEFVETMEDDAKATEYVSKTEIEKMERDEKLRNEVANTLTDAGFSSYKVNVAEWGMWSMMNKRFPEGFEYHCVPTKDGSLNIYGKTFNTKDGLIFVLKDPRGSVYIKAMSCSYDPMIDIKAVELMVNEVENTVDSLVEKKNASDNAGKIVIN